MKYRHRLWLSLAETNKIKKQKQKEQAILNSLIDKNEKHLLLDYSGDE